MPKKKRKVRYVTRVKKTAYRKSKSLLSIPKSPKALFNKTAAGVGGAVVGATIASMVPIPAVSQNAALIGGYGGALVAGGPVGLIAKFGFDMLMGGGIPALGGQGAASGNMVL